MVTGADYARDPANHCRPCGRILPRQRATVPELVPEGACPTCGRPALRQPLRGRYARDVAGEVAELLPTRGAWATARALGVQPAAVARALRRAGRSDLARPFEALAWSARKTTATTEKASA